MFKRAFDNTLRSIKSQLSDPSPKAWQPDVSRSVIRTLEHLRFSDPYSSNTEGDTEENDLTVRPRNTGMK